MYRLFVTGDLGFEFWMDIPGYEGLYQASTYVNVRSLKCVDSLGRFHDGKVMKKTLSNNGYYIVTFKKKGKKQFLVHRLIAMTFLPRRIDQTCVDHKDTDRTNCRVENLHWVTHSENMRNPITKQQMRPSFDAKQKKTYVYTTKGELVGVFPSFRKACSGTGCKLHSVWCVLTGEWKHTHNLVFSYEPQKVASASRTRTLD